MAKNTAPADATDVCVENMSDEALADCMDRLFRNRREAQIAIARRKANGPIVPVSEDLPKHPVKIVKRGQIVDEINRRKALLKAGK